MSDRVFSFRSIAVGLAAGAIMCCSNTYFGLQTGWVTTGSLQSALLGFGAFKALQRCGLGRNFSVGENVIIQTTSVAVAMIPLTAGLVSVIPALGLLTQKDNPPDGPVELSTKELILWTLAVAFFGAFAAVPLRQQTIIREKLKFPSGSATAEVIHLLHKKEGNLQIDLLDSGRPLDDLDEPLESLEIGDGDLQSLVSERNPETSSLWATSLTLLMIVFAISFTYKVIAELVTKDGDEILSSFPIFSWLGWETATNWGWTLYPAPGYMGQGMIMGPRTCISMLAGAVTGFVVLGPIAKSQGWASGEIGSLEDGAAGWVLWISLAVMLGDSLTSLSILAVRTVYQSARRQIKDKPVSEFDDPNGVPRSWWIIGIVVSTVMCMLIVSPMFSMPIYEPVVAVILASFVSILAVRATGETDLNPASGIGKISQIVFSVLAPGKIVANVIAGAIAEAGAVQAGDMMQDFKTAHLLGVPPIPQFFAQLIGSFVSVFLSVGVYRLFTTAWEVPSEELPVPSATIWLDMARLFNGGSLPDYVWLFAVIFAALAAATVLLKPFYPAYLPSGIGFAVGMYIGPKYTVPRVIGSLIEQFWLRKDPASHSTLMIVVASGLVLGEGTGAITVAFYRMFKAIL